MTEGPDFPGRPDVPGGSDLPDGVEYELPLAGLDAERPLPLELRARLEAALLAAVADGLPVPADAESLDAPRPLPEPLRARLESALLTEAAAAAAASSVSGDQRLAPASSASGDQRLAAASSATGRDQGTAVVTLQPRRRRFIAAWSAVAAVLVLILGAAGLVSISGEGGSGKVEVANAPTTTTAEAPASLPSGAGDSAGPPATATTGGPATPDGPVATATTRERGPVRPSTTTTRPTGPMPGANTENTGAPLLSPPAPSQPGGGATQPPPAQPGGWTGSPPPFYDSTAPSGEAASPPAMTAQPASPAPAGDSGPGENQKSNSPGTTATAPPLRVGVIPGDAAQEAGFRAYIDRLNQSGGVRGSSIQLAHVGPGSPATDTIATVNLGALPVAGPGGAPTWATGPLLETLTATENLLRGDGTVFSFSSAPERQGRLAAGALFPSTAAPGTKAVIYTSAAGPLRDVVPAAMRAVLEERGVEVEVVVFDPARRPAKLEAADAALLSLDPAAGKAWLAEARAANHRPPAGIAGIYSLADDSLLPDLPEGARVVSPYVAPGGDEGQAIRSGAGGTSASVLHGWATAKSLAAAIWRTGADTSAELHAALEGLTGWSSGLAPRYETRAGTRSRTPEGVVFRVQSQAFVADGGFRRDPY